MRFILLMNLVGNPYKHMVYVVRRQTNNVIYYMIHTYTIIVAPS